MEMQEAVQEVDLDVEITDEKLKGQQCLNTDE
jgi:hypothetical protein